MVLTDACSLDLKLHNSRSKCAIRVACEYATPAYRIEKGLVHSLESMVEYSKVIRQNQSKHITRMQYGSPYSIKND